MFKCVPFSKRIVNNKWGANKLEGKPMSSWSICLYRSDGEEDRLRHLYIQYLDTHPCADKIRTIEKARRENACYEATSIVNWSCRHCRKRKNEHFRRLGLPDQIFCRDTVEEATRLAAEEAERARRREEKNSQRLGWCRAQNLKFPASVRDAPSSPSALVGVHQPGRVCQ